MPAAPSDQQLPRPQEVFISYSRKDKEFVRRLDEALKSRDREAWVDWEGFAPRREMDAGHLWGDRRLRHVHFCAHARFGCIDVCGREIAHAAANNKRMVPIVAREVTADRVPEALGKLNWIFYRESDDFEEATDKLISALDTDLDWVHAHTRLLTRAIEWETKAKTTALFCAETICEPPSNGSRKRALKKNASPPRCKPNTSLRAAKLLPGANASSLALWASL